MQDRQVLLSTVLVRTQFRKDKEDGPVEEDAKELEVHQFVTEPAKVSYEVGLTMNLGNYESARITVGVTIPCYREELGVAMEFAKYRAEAEVSRVRKEIQEGSNASKKEMF